MKDAIQAVLVDPIEDSREAAQRLLGGLSSIWLAEVLPSYKDAARRVAEVLPSLVLADFDLMLGSVDACLDIIPDQTLHTIIQNIDRLDLTLLKRSITRHSSGLYVLPHPVAMEDAAKIDAESLRRVLALLKSAFPT